MSGRNAKKARTTTSRGARARRESHRHRIQWVVVGAVVLAVIGVGVFAAASSSDGSPPEPANLAVISGAGAQAPPPWPAPGDVSDRANAAGLSLGPMGTAEHYHAHLDVLVDGKPVQVPENIGVDVASGTMSGLHTHTPDGVIHIEAATQGQAFTLGQLFTEWNVALAPDRIGGLAAGGSTGKTLTIYVNGTKTAGDPAMLRLMPHQEIALVYGSPDQAVEVPATFDFGPNA